jgi:hypothetical protein
MSADPNPTWLLSGENPYTLCENPPRGNRARSAEIAQDRTLPVTSVLALTSGA